MQDGVMKFNTAIEFLITNYDELNAAVDVNQEIDFENIGGLRITVYSDSLENSLRTFLCSKNLSSSIQMISDKKPESKSDELVRNFDAYLLLYAPAIPNVKKACEFITKLSVKWKDLASIAIKEPGDRRNVLMQAVYYGKAKIVKLLMGMDPKLYETEDRLGNNPLLSASIYGRIDIINYFLNNCKKSHLVKSKSDQLNPLFCAIYGGKEDAVKFWLYNYPILYNDVSRLGDTPIAIARRYNRIEIAKYLENCVTTPSLPLEKVCDSSYSWLDCKEIYFSPSNDSFRNYCVAIVKDKWGRNATHILMSSIAIILSSPQLIFDENSPAYRNAIERAANQWNKLKLFIEYKIKADEVDDDNNHPVVAFLLALSKQQAETPFGWDVKLQQDKGAPYRQQLKTYLQLFLQYVQVDPEAIKKQYELQKWKRSINIIDKMVSRAGRNIIQCSSLIPKKAGSYCKKRIRSSRT